MKSNLLRSALVILTFLVAYYGKRVTGFSFESVQVNTALYYTWWIVPTALVAGLLYGFKNLPGTLGLDKSVLKGLGFAAIAVAPMFVGYAIIGQFNPDLNGFQLLRGTMFAGFFEEWLFRGFLFGILFRKLGWGFIPAGILGALFFGIAHIYQGSSLAHSAGIASVTAIGALWFAWLFIEWEENLWVPVFLHALMNLSWVLFDISDNALGDGYANVFRIITIAATVILTIRRIKSKGASINRTNLIRPGN